MNLSVNVRTKILKYFAQKPTVTAVYLYGSQATGEATSKSDIDLAVVASDYNASAGLDIPQITFAQELSAQIGKKIEVQNLKDCSVNFSHRVITEGKLLLVNDERARVKFEERLMNLYFDLKPALDEYFEELSQIARRGDLHVRYT